MGFWKSTPKPEEKTRKQMIAEALQAAKDNSRGSYDPDVSPIYIDLATGQQEAMSRAHDKQTAERRAANKAAAKRREEDAERLKRAHVWLVKKGRRDGYQFPESADEYALRLEVDAKC